MGVNQFNGDETRGDCGVKESLKSKQAGSRLKWTGHI